MTSSKRARRETMSVAPRVPSRLAVLLTGLALVATSASSARAVDMCMAYTGGGGLAFKRFKAPRKNTCAPLQAFEPATKGAGVSATACTTSSGRWMILHYSSHNWEGDAEYSESATCRVLLPIPATSGPLGRCDGSFSTSPGGQGGFAQSAVFQLCTADIPE